MAFSGFRTSVLVVFSTFDLSIPSPVAQLPCESISTIRTRKPNSATLAAILITEVVFPTPPFKLIIETTLANPFLVGVECGRSIACLGFALLSKIFLFEIEGEETDSNSASRTMLRSEPRSPIHVPSIFYHIHPADASALIC